jgi:hypothetical protein
VNDAPEVRKNTVKVMEQIARREARKARRSGSPKFNELMR